MELLCKYEVEILFKYFAGKMFKFIIDISNKKYLLFFIYKINTFIF